MAIRNIRQEGDEILKKKSREVEIIDEKIVKDAHHIYEIIV